MLGFHEQQAPGQRCDQVLAHLGGVVPIGVLPDRLVVEAGRSGEVFVVDGGVHASEVKTQAPQRQLRSCAQRIEAQETQRLSPRDPADRSVPQDPDDGTAIDQQPYNNFNNGNVNQQRGYGLDNGNTKVRIVEQFKNSESNHLGMPLPAGRIRLYRRDADGQMEFVGEDMITHTPAEETVKLATGSAFDVKGSRRQTDFHINQQDRMVDESFEIKVTNQKQQPINVTVIEHLYRGVNWEIREKSAGFTKRDSRSVEFPLQLPAKGETTLTYSVRYTW